MDSYMPHDFWLLSRGKTKVMGIMFFVYFFSWCFAVLIAIFFVVVQLLSHVQLVATSWISACLASMSFTVSRSCSNSCPLSQWCHPTISFSVIPLSCLLSFPASESFLMSQLFASGGQSIGASASVLPMNTQDWFPLSLTGLISLQSKGLSKVFSNTTIQNHQFFSTQPSLSFNSHIHTWLEIH